MSKLKYNFWENEISFEDSKINDQNSEILDEAYGALTKFYQKDRKRNKQTQKSCWQ